MTEHRNGGAPSVENPLAAHCVDTIFCIPGTHNLEMVPTLPDDCISGVYGPPRQGAGTADAYARVTAACVVGDRRSWPDPTVLRRRPTATRSSVPPPPPC